jgi:dUTPase
MTITKKKVTARPISNKATKTALKDYCVLGDREVAVKVQFDEVAFTPIAGEHGYFDLMSNMPLDAAGQRRTNLSHRSTIVVDCGVEITVPEGYRAVLKVNELLAKKGLIIPNAPSYHTGGRVKVQLSNFGREIIQVNHLDKVAQIAVEPIYTIKWEAVVE